MAADTTERMNSAERLLAQNVNIKYGLMNRDDWAIPKIYILPTTVTNNQPPSNKQQQYMNNLQWWKFGRWQSRWMLNVEWWLNTIVN